MTTTNLQQGPHAPGVPDLKSGLTNKGPQEETSQNTAKSFCAKLVKTAALNAVKTIAEEFGTTFLEFFRLELPSKQVVKDVAAALSSKQVMTAVAGTLVL